MLAPVAGDKDDVQPRGEGRDVVRECRRPGGRDPRAASAAWEGESRLLDEAKQATLAGGGGLRGDAGASNAPEDNTHGREALNNTHGTKALIPRLRKEGPHSKIN